MAQERPSIYDRTNPDSEAQLSELQRLLVGEYIQSLHDQRERLEKLEDLALRNSREVARTLAKDSKEDPKVRKALHPVVEDALRASVEENPSLMAGIFFPMIGEAVRKAVAHAMQQALDSTNELLANSFSVERIKWRFEAWRSGRSFAEVALAHSLSYRVEHIYVIHRTTGLLLGQVTNQANLLQDSDMVVGMLTAIQDFVRDSFTANQQSDLDVIQVGEFKIWLQHGPVALLAAVISGQPKGQLREVLVRHIEFIHRNYATGMAHFETTGQAIPGLEEDLEECLVEEKQEKAKQAHSYTKFKVAGVLLLILFCVGAFFYIRRALTWSDYVSRLRHQPGIVVIDDTRTWRTLSVRGFRDPMAIDPVTLLEQYRLDPKEVSGHWETYNSLDPRFADVRRLNNEADAVRRVAVRFTFDSTTMPLDQLALLDGIAEQIRELSADAARQRRYLHIQVFGHTDSSGTSQHNDTLSLSRADMIVQFLVMRGIPPSILTAVGLRDTQAQYGQNIPVGQDLDRRVTFSVDVR